METVVIRCLNCGFDSPEEMRFCGECGMDFGRPQCGRCGFLNPIRYKYCGQCGDPLVAGAAAPPRKAATVSSIAPAQPVAPAQPIESTQQAERRQLTVMFCDLVGSTKLSEQLDAEVLRELVRAYQEACAEVTENFAGHIAQYLGDGLLVYFGYPTAHEDDPRRAVRAALGILEAMQTLNHRVEVEHDLRLSLRIGIHTGMVVVGEIGGGATREHLALGDTPNLAARVQGEAEPDTVAISHTTHALVEGLFTFQSIGKRSLKGIAEPIEIYQVLDESEMQSRFDASISKGLTPLVGRHGEVQLLLDRWQQTKSGSGQVVLLSGDAGVGKSRMVQELRQRIADDPHGRLEFRCQTYYQNSAFYPVIDYIQRLLRLKREDDDAERLAKLEAALSDYELPLDEAVPLLAPFMSISLDDRYEALEIPPAERKERTLEMVIAWLAVAADREPLLSVWEDVQWADPSSLEFLSLHLIQASTAPINVIVTYRPEYVPPWEVGEHISQTTLGRLVDTQAEELVHQVTQETKLPAEVVSQLVAKTDGVPLFIEELTKTVMDAITSNDGTEANTIAIPATLQDSLMARLDRLGSGKEIAQLGAALGRAFDYPLIEAVAGAAKATVQRELSYLCEAGILAAKGDHYRFRQTLIQDAAYQSLLRSTRLDYHSRIAERLEENFPETVEAHPELIAHHYTEAGKNDQAIAYWRRAGQRAIERSANLEAIAHLNNGLNLVGSLSDETGSAQTELDLQLAISVPLRATQGFTSANLETAYYRARELCREVGGSPKLFPVLRRIGVFCMVRGDLPAAYDVNQQMLQIAESANDDALILEAQLSLGLTITYQGEFEAAHAAFERAIELYVREEHHQLAHQYGDDPCVVALAYDAIVLQLLGFPDQAHAASTRAIELATELEHPFSLALALNFYARLYQLRADIDLSRERVEACIKLSDEHGFAHWSATGQILLSWILAHDGEIEEGHRKVSEGIAVWRGIGARIALPYFYSMQADVHARDGNFDQGLALLEEAQSIIEDIGERSHEAEIYRLQGELLLRSSKSANHDIEIDKRAAECFEKAVSVAREQSAKFWELRATTSASRLLRLQGKAPEARIGLEATVAEFGEGHDTSDFEDARALLAELN